MEDWVKAEGSLSQHVLVKKFESLLVKLSATLEDYPPLVLATLGGFLQQLFGARRLLQVDKNSARLTAILTNRKRDGDTVHCLSYETS